jgi:arsenate reductase-like glutaredoxin family protein
MKFSNNLYELSEIEVYDLVLNGTLRAFPHGFWDGVDGYQNAKKILKHVFEDILKWSINDIKTKATREVFDEYKLDRMISSAFDGSIFIAIGEVYPELKEWAEELYREKEYVEFEHKRYTDEELISFLQEKAKEIDKIPRASDMHNPSGMTYSKRFGTWEKALMRAGLIEDIYKGIDLSRYSKEVVIEHFKEICINKERMLDKEELYEFYPEGVIKEFFGSYPTIKKILENDYTQTELISILKKKQKKLGRIPTNKDMKFPRAIVFIDKFGSWQNAIEEISKG